MKGLIYSEPADLLETGERSKGNEPGINTKAFIFDKFIRSGETLVTKKRLYT